MLKLTEQKPFLHHRFPGRTWETHGPLLQLLFIMNKEREFITRVVFATFSYIKKKYVYSKSQMLKCVPCSSNPMTVNSRNRTIFPYSKRGEGSATLPTD